MPTIYRYTPSELIAIQQSMKEYPPEQVEKDYRLSKISLKDKLLLLQNYGAAQREIAIRSEIEASTAKTAEVKKLGGGGYSGAAFGEAKYYLQNVAKEFKGAWDAATAEGEPKKSEAAFRAMMGALETLKVFDIPGDVAERWTLEALPDSPGLARAVNWAVWIPTNFLGISTLLKAPLKAMTGTAKGVVKAGAAITDYASFLRDPVKYAIKEAGAYEAVTATKLAKATAENVTRKGAGVAGAAIKAEQQMPAGPTIFRGGKSFDINQIGDRGASFTSEEARATLRANKVQGGGVDRFQLNEGAKIGEYDTLAAEYTKATGKTADPMGKTGPMQFLDDVAKFAKSQGYDAMRVDAFGEKEIRVFTSNALLNAEAKGGTQAFKVAGTETPAITQAAQAAGAALSPQDLESMTVKELINHYAERSEKMIRSSTKPFKYKGVSHAETEAAAAARPTDIWEILGRGADEPVSATELARIKPIHEEVLKNFNKVLDEASGQLAEIGGGTRPDLVAAYKAHFAAAELTNPAFLSARGQAGRALEFTKTMQPLINDSLTFDVLTRSLGSEKLLEGSDKAVAYTMNKLYLLGKNERGKLLEAAGRNEYDPGTMRLLYKSLLFARPGIHVANISGNTDSIMAYGINKSMSSFMPWSKTTWREASAYWSGMAESRSTFFELWNKAAQHSSAAKAGIEGVQNRAWVKNGPLGWLGFEDEVMEEVVSNGLAKSKAVTEGLTKWDEIQAAVKAGIFDLPRGQTKRKFLAEFVDSSMSNPHNYGRLVEETKKEADYIIFHSPLSRGGESIARGIRESILDYGLPIIKFPINGLKMGRDWTPVLQMFSKRFVEGIAEGGAKADLLRSQMTLSWMVSGQVYEAALRGEITGNGPSDRKARDAWIAAGNTPYAIHGIPIKWAEPFGTWFGFIADLAHAKNEMTEDNLQSAFEAIVMAGTRAVESNYWLRIMDGVTNAIGDVKQVKDLNDIIGSTVKLLGQPIKTLATGGTVGRVVGEMVNPEAADLKFYDDFSIFTGELGDLKNWFFANTMFGTDTRPKLNYSGRITITPPVAGANWLKENLGLPDWAARGTATMFLPPMRQNTGENDPVGQFMDKHGLTLNNNWKYYGGSADPDKLLPLTDAKPRVSLTGDQAYNWQSISLNDARQRRTNRTWLEAIEALDNDPRFLAKDKDKKQDDLNLLYTTFRDAGRKILRDADPEVAAKEKERDLLEAQRTNNPSLIMRLIGAVSSESSPVQEEQAVERPVEATPLPEATEVSP